VMPDSRKTRAYLNSRPDPVWRTGPGSHLTEISGIGQTSVKT
jgi:hypothetical protein